MQHFDYYLAEIFVVVGIASAAVIAADLRSCRQGMRIMNSVWILTGLWASIFGLWAYFAFGRARQCLIDEKSPRKRKSEAKEKRGMAAKGKQTDGMDKMDQMPGMTMEGMQTDGMESMGSMKGRHNETGHAMRAGDEMRAGKEMRTSDEMRMQEMDGMPGMPMDDMPPMRMGERMEVRPRWQSVVLSTLHCGAGCTLADLVGEWLLYFVPVAILGSVVAGSWVVDYVLALAFGIGFQYAAIRGMNRTLPRKEAVKRAAKADILSLTAWQVGMYGWMAVVIFALNAGQIPDRTSFYFWFMMQVAMACGFVVALPVNVWLIRKGIKHGM